MASEALKMSLDLPTIYYMHLPGPSRMCTRSLVHLAQNLPCSVNFNYEILLTLGF